MNCENAVHLIETVILKEMSWMTAISESFKNADGNGRSNISQAFEFARIPRLSTSMGAKYAARLALLITNPRMNFDTSEIAIIRRFHIRLEDLAKKYDIQWGKEIVLIGADGSIRSEL